MPKTESSNQRKQVRAAVPEPAARACRSQGARSSSALRGANTRPVKRVPLANAAGIKTPRLRLTVVSQPVSAASEAPEIMVTLNNEHRYIASILDALAEQADTLLPGGSPDYAMMHDMVHYMSNYPDEYHHPREDLVFGKLLERDADARLAVQQLLDGHREINRRSKELLVLLARIVREGRTPDDRKLKYLFDSYIGYYWDHINTEEGKVFPRATAKLRQADWHSISSKAKHIDDPLFGTRVKKEYVRLSSYLADRVARVSEDVAIVELFGIEALIESAAALASVVGQVRGVFANRLRLSTAELAQVSRHSFDTPGMGTVVALPGKLSTAVCMHIKDGAGELKSVLVQARTDLGEPFSERFRYLRKLMSS